MLTCEQIFICSFDWWMRFEMKFDPRMPESIPGSSANLGAQAFDFACFVLTNKVLQFGFHHGRQQITTDDVRE